MAPAGATEGIFERAREKGRRAAPGATRPANIGGWVALNYWLSPRHLSELSGSPSVLRCYSVFRVARVERPPASTP